jgi:hypothetical protein
MESNGPTTAQTANAILNPFIKIQERIWDGVYPEPSAGFEARLIILLTLSV